MKEITLNLDQINATPALREAGALAGDKIVDGELVRVFSKEDAGLGLEITQANIDATPALQGMNAEPGDRIKDGKVIHTGQDSAWTAFRYGKAKGEEEGLLDQGTEILESYFPTTGRIIDYGLETIGDALFPNPFQSMEDRKKLYSKTYQSPDEKYGEGFSEATPEIRREMMLREKERNLQKKFRGYVPKGGASEIIGNMYGALKDPTTLLPAGGTVKTMMLSGAALGGGYSAVDDMAKSGRGSSSFLPANIDPVKFGLFATAGAALPGAFAVAPKIVRGSAGLYTKKTSQKTVNKAQAIIAKRKTQGINLTEQDMPQIAEELGMSTNRLLSSFEAQGVSPKVYNSVDEAEKALNAAISEDSGMLRVVSKNADNFLGAISTRLKNIDDGLYGRLMRMEFNMHKTTDSYLERVDPFSQEVSKLPALAKQELNKLLASRDHAGADQWMRQRGYDVMADSFGEVKKVLQELGDQLPIKADMEGYFPRNVRNHNKFLEALGVNPNDEISIALRKAADAKKKSVENLTSYERDRVIEKVALGKAGGTGTKTERMKQAMAEAREAKKAKGLKGTLSKKERDAVVARVLKGHKPIGDKGLGQTKKRTVKDETLTDELMAHYRSPEESLQAYIRTSVNNLEKKKFFQGSAVDNLDGDGIHLEGSIDSLIKNLRTTRELDGKQVEELKDVISARFGAEDVTMHGAAKGVKNLGYIGTLGDFMSTMTQLTDVPNVMGYHGFYNTAKAAFGPKVTKMEDIGVTDIARELGETGNFTKTLNTVLKWTGFKRIDRFGKETLMQAVRNKTMKQLKTDSGVQKFREKWSDVYGPDIDRVINDLQTGTKSELTNLHFFTKLSEHQPISYSEYPAAYLRNPNGRLLYMLKSFTLKQYDLVRRNLYQEYKKAPTKWAKAKVLGKTAKVAGFMAAGGLSVDKTKDLILGRDVRPEDLLTDAMWSLIGAYGITRYAGEQAVRKGDVVGIGENLLSVPLPVFKGLQDLLTGDVAGVAKQVPGIGRTLHSRAFGGAKKYNRKKRKGKYR